MATVDTIIDNQVIRTNAFSSQALYFTNVLQTFINDRNSGLYLPAVKLEDGTVVSALDLSSLNFPTFTALPKDGTPMPVYEQPTSTLPVKPALAGIANVTLPASRVEPVINTSNLFKQVAPSPNLPEFTENEPDLGIDALVDEMDALLAPVLSEIQFPEIKPLAIRATPQVSAPSFIEVDMPAQIAEPADYVKKYDDTYRQMLPEMQAYVDGRTQIFVDTYAPEYNQLKNKLSDKLQKALDGGAVPDQLEAAIYARAQGRVEKDYAANEVTLLESGSKRNMLYAPGAIAAGINKARLAKAESLANQATDIYIQRMQLEAQFYQFALSQAQGQVSQIRNMVLAHIGLAFNAIQQSMSYAESITQKLGMVFEHLIARAQISVAIMDALGRQYDARLRASLANLEIFKAELDTEKVKKDVEIAVIQALETKVRAESLQVERYRIMIDAIARKGELEQLKLRGYEIRADIFKNNTNAKLAAYDVYKAGLEGDKAKLQGEMAKLQLYETQVKTDQLNLESQIKAIEATQSVNDAKIRVYQNESDIFKLDLEASLKKFSAQAEVKKLAQTVYGQELDNNIKSFQAKFDSEKIKADLLFKQYEMSVNTAIEEAKLDLTKLQIAERAAEAATDAMTRVAASSAGSLNAVVSSALQAAA